MMGRSSGSAIVVQALLCRAVSQLFAPLDTDQACLALGNAASSSSGTVLLLDSHQYISLEGLWFADDESIDLFEFPVPQDPVKWELIDQSECRNIWQYCGESPTSTDILISQFITGVHNSSSNDEVIISIEFSFFSRDMNACSLETSEMNVLIVEVDDTTGQDNVHIELISLCIDNQPSHRHDFMYIPMNRFFELVFRSNLTSGVCLNVSRVRVFYCEGHYFNVEAGQCFLCPDFSSSSRDRCICDIGHRRSSPSNYSIPCDGCVSGYFDSGNGSCIPCPLPGFDSIDSAADACQCFNETLSSNLTSSNTCEFCAVNYTRNSSLLECVLCPAGSRRDLTFTDSGDPSLESEGFCTCTEGSSTQSRQNITSFEICDCCSAPLIWTGTQCVPCPANSQPAASGEECTCDLNTLTLAGQSETSTHPCFCVDGFYRSPGSRSCQNCPPNSFRALSDREDFCFCLEGFTRESEVDSPRCLAYIGFNTSSLLLMEGVGQQVNNITVFLSRLSTDSISVNISVMTSDRDLGVQIRPNYAILTNTETLDLTLTHVGNTVALERDASFNLSLLVSEMEDLIVGGPGLFGELNVVIADDDLLHVGFTEDMLVYEASKQTGSIRVNISRRIGREVVILIRANDTLSPDLHPSLSRELIFSPMDPTSQLFEFDIEVDRDITSYVLISLEVATYPESLNSVRDKITVGRFPGLYQEAVLLVEVQTVGTERLSRSGVIGIASSVAVVCFNVAVILGLFFVYICYKRHCTSKKGDRTNRQGVEMTNLTAENLKLQEDQDSQIVRKN